MDILARNPLFSKNMFVLLQLFYLKNLEVRSHNLALILYDWRMNKKSSTATNG